MNVSHFIARRVAGSGQPSFSRLIIRVAVIAIAISVAVMICSTALVRGFKNEIREKIFGFWGHIHITDTDFNRSMIEARPISIEQDFYPSLDTLGRVRYLRRGEFMGQATERMAYTNGGVKHIQAYGIIPGIISTKEEMEGIILKGVGADYDFEFIEQYLKEGTLLTFNDSTPSRDILISVQTANRLELELGDKFNFTTFDVSGEQLVRRFTITGIYRTGLEEYDKQFALVDLRQVQKLQGWRPYEISGFEVIVDDLDDIEPLTNHIYFEHLPNNVYAEPIRRKLPEIFDWLDLQDVNEKVILGLMLLVAVINMITALLILILERTNMIGILKALGSSNGSIRRVFLFYAAYIIGIGLPWGNAIGIGLCLAQQYFKFIRLPEESYYLNVAPVELNFWAIVMINVGTLVITMLFLFLPSYLVTRIDPVRAIRFK